MRNCIHSIPCCEKRARTGMRAPQPAKPQRPPASTLKIMPNPPRPDKIHQLETQLIFTQKNLAPIFPPTPSDSLNASPTKSAPNHAHGANKEKEETQHRDATRHEIRASEDPRAILSPTSAQIRHDQANYSISIF